MGWSNRRLRRHIAKHLQRWADGLLAALRHSVGVGQGVHEARRMVKRLRSALLLIKPAIAQGDAERTKAELRRIAHALAAPRTAAVMADLAIRLDLDPRRRSRFERARERAAVLLRPRLPGLIVLATRIRARIASWPRRLGTRACWARLRSSFARARRRYREAAAHPTEARLHAWRKRVQHLAHQCRLLRKHGGRRLHAWTRRCEELSGILGDLHDLQVLIRQLPAAPAGAMAQVRAVRTHALQLGKKRLHRKVKLRRQRA